MTSLASALRDAAYRAGYSIRRVQSPNLRLYETYPGESVRLRRFYNLGAGAFRHPCWTNVDHATPRYAPVQGEFLEHDLTSGAPLPILDGSAELVYSSHTIEHLPAAAVDHLCREAYRVLRPRGGLRITTPDAALEYAAMRRGDRALFAWIDEFSRPGMWEPLYRRALHTVSLAHVFVEHMATQVTEISRDETAAVKYGDAEIADILAHKPMAEALDTFAGQCRYNAEFPGSHCSWWTADTLMAVLRAAGFREVYQSGYGQSRFPPMRELPWFDSTWPSISLYVEAVR